MSGECDDCGEYCLDCNGHLTDKIMNVIHLANEEKNKSLQSVANCAALICLISENPKLSAKYFCRVFQESMHDIMETDVN